MKPLVVANWKMNPTSLAEAKRIFNAVKRGIKNVRGVEVVFCPPFLYLPFIKSGAQDVFFEEKGAYTGEISPLMLKDIGVKYVIVGHSERRQVIGETDQVVNKKLKAAIIAGLKPILCIGETTEEKAKTQTETKLESQLRKGLVNVPSFPRKGGIQKVIIAYEPIWAIGTGNPCEPEDAKSAAFFIREVLTNLFGRQASSKIRILYGGSVTSKNAQSYIKEAKMDGLLVGGASLKPEEFVDIIKAVCYIK